MRGNSELVFYNNSIKNKITSFKIGEKEIAIGGDKEFLILNSNANLLRLRPHLENAISILQGGRTFYRVGFYKGKLELSFRKNIKEAKPYGLIYTEEKDISEYFTKYIDYMIIRKNQSNKKLELFISYFLDSCNQLIHLENRMVDLFIALEINDNSTNLNKNTLKNILEIDSNDAAFVIKVRNHLIHKGQSLKVSIEESKKEMDNFTSKYEFPFKAKSKRQLPGSFYFYVLSRTYHYILSEIGMNNLDIRYSQFY